MQQPDLTSIELDLFPQTPVPIPDGAFWVFGYGSLMWRPDFPHVETRDARLFGFHRQLCVWSALHRGTLASPGLVLGLDSGGSCVGRAFLVEEKIKLVVAETLRKRELVTNVYIPCVKPIQFSDGSRAKALVFVVRRNHIQYSGRLHPQQAAAIVADARGASGSNRDYILNTVEHLEQAGIHDVYLHQVKQLLYRADRRGAGIPQPDG